jgi:hypothetical protein
MSNVGSERTWEQPYGESVRKARFQAMQEDSSHPKALSYGEVRATLSRRADFESHQEGVGKVSSYVLNVRPRSSRYEPFTLTGPDLSELLRDALSHLAPT